MGILVLEERALEKHRVVAEADMMKLIRPIIPNEGLTTAPTETTTIGEVGNRRDHNKALSADSIL